MSDNQNVAVETLAQDAQNVPVPKEKQVKNKELIIFLTSVFFYTMITGMASCLIPSITRRQWQRTFVIAFAL